MTPSHPDRQRDYEAPHIRHLDIQILDALIRIEELMIEAAKERLRAAPLTPEEAAPAPKATTRKNPRSL